MPRRYYLLLLTAWPGLAQMWTGQELLGVILAVQFALAFNLALVGSSVWTDLLPSGGVSFLMALAALTWTGTLTYTAWWLWRCHPERYRREIDRLFRESLEFYLRGRWVEARDRCERILSHDENDAEALLQLGLIHVRTGQQDLARQALRQCLDLEGGARWKWEIQQTLQRLGTKRSG